MYRYFFFYGTMDMVIRVIVYPLNSFIDNFFGRSEWVA